MLRAHVHAGRLKPDIDAMGAVIAFGGRMGFRINVQRIIWAGLHTALTADTPARIKIDDAVLTRI